MIEDILTNIIASAVCAGLAYAVRKMTAFFSAPPASPQGTVKYSRRLVRNQFLISLFVLIFSLPVGFLLTPSTMLLCSVKMFLFIAAGYSFIFLWGAFDAAFEFYPPDNSRENKPPEQSANQT